MIALDELISRVRPRATWLAACAVVLGLAAFMHN